MIISLRQTLEFAPRIGFARETRVSQPIQRGRHARATESADDDPKVSGGDVEEATPDPIPNSEVKLVGADGTAREAVWESRTLPGILSRKGRDPAARKPDGAERDRAFVFSEFVVPLGRTRRALAAPGNGLPATVCL